MFICELCDYNTPEKGNYAKHLTTYKHRSKLNFKKDNSLSTTLHDIKKDNMCATTIIEKSKTIQKMKKILNLDAEFVANVSQPPVIYRAIKKNVRS